MMARYRITLLSLLLLCLSWLTAEEIPLMDTAKWFSHYPKSKITTMPNGIVTLTNGASFEYSEKITIDPTKRYSVTMEACSKAPNGMVSLAFIPYTAGGKRVNTENIVCAINSLTFITADAKPGDTVIKVKDISYFNKNLMGNCLLAVGAKDDFSDLPNFHLIKVKATKEISKSDGGYALTLAAPLKETLAAGTPVRQHYYGSAFYFTHGMRQKLAPSWQSYEAHLVGVAKQCSPVKFPHGTVQIRIQIYFAIPANATAKIRNLKLTILPREIQCKKSVGK